MVLKASKTKSSTYGFLSSNRFSFMAAIEQFKELANKELKRCNSFRGYLAQRTKAPDTYHTHRLQNANYQQLKFKLQQHFKQNQSQSIQILPEHHNTKPVVKTNSCSGQIHMGEDFKRDKERWTQMSGTYFMHAWTTVRKVQEVISWRRSRSSSSTKLCGGLRNKGSTVSITKTILCNSCAASRLETCSPCQHKLEVNPSFTSPKRRNDLEESDDTFFNPNQFCEYK